MSVEEYRKVQDRLKEMINQKAQEMGIFPPNYRVHNELYRNNEDFKKLHDGIFDFDVAVRDQYHKEEAEKREAENREKRRQAQIRANNGFGGRRRSKKSKRKQRKTRRR